MPKGMVQISMLGDKALQKQLDQMEEKVAWKVVRSAMRKRGNRVYKKMLENISGNPIRVRTGALLNAMRGLKVTAGKRRKHWMQQYIPLPTRASLGIKEYVKSEKSTHGYYPSALEYGWEGVPPKRWVRGAADHNKTAENALMAREIGKGIEREAAKKRKLKRG